MKTLIQKIHLEDNQSFACRTYKTPQFETNWHKHEECELILITEGQGTVMAGDYVGEYVTGDIFFLAANLPHWFRKQHPKTIGSAIVIHFKQNLFGDIFLSLPEMKPVNYFLQKNNGIQLNKKINPSIHQLIRSIETSEGFQRINLLLQAIQQICSTSNHSIITRDFISVNSNINPAIEKIIDFSFKHYLEALTLEQVAKVAGMSIPTFCRFFKKNIKKTYFDFLQELRISHACKLLTDSDKAVLAICYESGYNSWAHFSKQFKKVKQITPTQYRKEFVEKVK